MAEEEKATKRDLGQGFSVGDLADGAVVLGQVGSEDVVLVRRADVFFAVGASCTHYHGMLSQGLVVGGTLRCPLHHACFGLRTGEALRAPALDADPALAGRKDRREGICSRETRRPRSKTPTRLRGGTEPSRFGRDHRRWRRRHRSRGHAAPGRLRWSADLDQRG